MTQAFDVELDLHLIYAPPMREDDTGIVITRGFKLPYAPFVGLRLHSRTWHDDPTPYGVEVERVVWDCDRSVFLVDAGHTTADMPIALIPIEVRDWLGRGWSWGSYSDRYEEEDESTVLSRPHVGQFVDPTEGIDPSLIDSLHTLSPKERPRAFNVFFKALIGYMVQNGDSIATAYAMDKTQQCLGLGHASPTDPLATATWMEHQTGYGRIPLEERVKWVNKARKYPALADVILGTKK